MNGVVYRRGFFAIVLFIAFYLRPLEAAAAEAKPDKGKCQNKFLSFEANLLFIQVSARALGSANMCIILYNQ